MAEYQGKSVKLDSPSRIQKGEPGYGRKKFKVYVKDGDRVKRLCLETQIWKSEKITQKLENHLELDINVIQQRTRLQLDTGLVKCGNYGKTS
jgi:hypothetical protein